MMIERLIEWKYFFLKRMGLDELKGGDFDLVGVEFLTRQAGQTARW
jgi:hypothetical protein